MSNIQTGAERMPHDLSHLGFLAGQIGRLITISTTPVIAGDSFEMDAVGALRLSPLRRGLAIDSTVDIFTFYVPHRHVYGEQWIKFMKDGVNATPLPTVNTTGYIDHAAFLGTINPDTNKIPKHLFQGYLNIYNNYFKATWMPDRTEANPNELNQDDARYGFRCCHLKNIWTAPLPPETELSRQMATSTTSIDIMGLQAAYANLHTDQERDYFMQRYHDVISSFGGKTSYDADNRPLLVMRYNLWASGYDVDGTDQTSLGQFSGRVPQTYKHSVQRFFVPEHGTMFTLALFRFPPIATKEIQYLNAKGALTYTDIAGDPVLYGNLPPREISMKESTARVASIMENTNLSKQQQVSEIMRQMLTQAQTAGQYFTNDQIKGMTRKVSAEVDLVHQQTQNQRCGSSHIGATAKDISHVVTGAASGVVDIFHGMYKAVADTWNNFWKDGKADGIGSNLSRKYPSGLTPSQLYVFMPPNLGGFFMVRSYYPSECHADYFDFERIEALKPAIEACGISTLSQSPMLGFHKQMDNRIKLLEEILSFRMQGVEFDNGDMYVDGHKAASDVRDEFVSVTEKLMDELAQCYNVLPQLDINNTIDHRPEGDEKWFLENEKTVTQFCSKLAAERPLKDIRDEYNYPKKKGIKDECSRLLETSTMKSRRGFAIQRLMNAMRQAHADGWLIVFDTLTLADDRLEAFYDNPNALRDYFRDIGRMVFVAEGRKANDSHADCYQYFCVPEYGTANGRVNFHSVLFMRTLPTGSVDPNFGRRVRNRRQLNSLQNTWPYGYSMPIAVRYTQDAFSRSGWLWPVDAKGEPLKATSYMAVGFYVAKYVNKKLY